VPCVKFYGIKGSMRAYAQKALGWIAAREASVLVALLLAAGAVWLFVEVADEVLEGETRGTDERLMLMLRTAEDPSDPLGPSWVEELARDVTAMGSAGILALITAAAAGFLTLQRKRPLALYLAAAVAGGTVLSSLLKWGFARPRPDLVAHGQAVYTSSFPSGHSMVSAIAYLTLGALLASSQTSRAMHAYLIGLAVFLTVIVGVSRVYLGVHWPTDVLAGWTAGAAWALVCFVVAKRLHVRGTVE
jgi:undecaprenyl-diphosphatase